MKDDEIIRFLLTLRHPTFFTLDQDYFNRGLCHARYCLVFLDVKRDESAVFIRRLLRHKEFDTQARHMEAVMRTDPTMALAKGVEFNPPSSPGHGWRWRVRLGWCWWGCCSEEITWAIERSPREG